MKKQGIIRTKRPMTFRESLGDYLRQWKHAIICLHPKKSLDTFPPKWKAETCETRYVEEDDPDFKNANLIVKYYDGPFGRVSFTDSRLPQRQNQE